MSKTQKSPKISILVPIYNGGHYLKECISSVLNQSYSDFELILSDDGSTDGSLDYIHSIADPRVKRLFNKHGGLFRNLNATLEHVRSDLILFLCQDDRLAPSCLGEIVSFYQRYPHVGMILLKTTIIDDRGQIENIGRLWDLPEIILPSLSNQHLFFHGCIAGNLSAMCITRQCLKEVGHFDESYGVSADYELMSRVCEKWNLGILQKNVVEIRSHSKQ